MGDQKRNNNNYCGLKLGSSVIDVGCDAGAGVGAGGRSVAMGISGAGTGVWISPPIPAGGLTTADADGWILAWSPMQYDPDPIVGRFGYAAGATHYFDGWLYWGTIHLQSSKALSIH